MNYFLCFLRDVLSLVEVPARVLASGKSSGFVEEETSKRTFWLADTSLDLLGEGDSVRFDSLPNSGGAEESLVRR